MYTCIFLDEAKVLKYFGNVRHYSAALDAFAKIVNVTNQVGLWDAELAWCSPTATC